MRSRRRILRSPMLNETPAFGAAHTYMAFPASLPLGIINNTFAHTQTLSHALVLVFRHFL